MKLVLASQSPRRKMLLEQLGLSFTTHAPNIDEDAQKGLPAQELVKALSREKALHIARTEPQDTIVIGSDTVVVLDGAILGKPDSPEKAREMLSALSGRSHEVCTGVTVCRGDQMLSDVAVTQVTFRPLSAQEIDHYVATGEPMDKAGAYGIQGYGALLVAGISGDYNNVVGLPLGLLDRLLRPFGVDCLALAAAREEDTP